MATNPTNERLYNFEALACHGSQQPKWPLIQLSMAACKRNCDMLESFGTTNHAKPCQARPTLSTLIWLRSLIFNPIQWVLIVRLAKLEDMHTKRQVDWRFSWYTVLLPSSSVCLILLVAGAREHWTVKSCVISDELQKWKLRNHKFLVSRSSVRQTTSQQTFRGF